MNTREKKEIDKLRKEINRHNHLYHVLDSPKITDYEYDLLFARLRSFEKKFPASITPHSPTQRIGARAEGKASMIRHVFPMLSLGNVFNKEALIYWTEKIKKQTQKEKPRFFCELKVDGIAISVTYKKGKLFKAVTRGDGNEGEDVTNNVRTIKSLPLSLEDNAPATIEVRGEIFVSFNAFEKLNKQQTNNKQQLFSSTRNLAAGTVRQLDPQVAAERKLDIFVYGIGEISAGNFLPGTQGDLQEFLQRMGFKVNPRSRLCAETNEVIEFCEKWENSFKTLPFPVDGLVIKTDSFKDQEKIGNTPREPKWAIAYKFPASQGITQLKQIKISVGRTGRITPFGVLEPIVISGSKIRHATLHNYENILRKDLREGDFVVVEKAGEVIPKIKESILERRTGKERSFLMPKKCPACLTDLVKIENEVAVKCENILCKGRLREKLKHFVSRSAMNIEAFGEKLSSQLIDLGKIRDFSDIYLLEEKELENIERMGEILSKKIIQNIQSSKNRPLFRLLYGLGIPHVGIDTARILSNVFGSLYHIAKATKTEMLETKHIGEKTANSIESFFSQEENIEKIKKLSRLGVQVEDRSVNKAQGFFYGKKICVTGSLEFISRQELAEEIELQGGNVVSSVTKGTDYLIEGINPGSKLKKAKSLNISVLKADILQKILKQEQGEPED